MSNHSNSNKQLCPVCAKSYVNLRAHLRSDFHKRHIAQIPLLETDRALAENLARPR